MLERCIRYMCGTRKAALYLRPRGPLRICGYANKDRKSCSGGVLVLANALVTSYSSTQAIIALSTCEAELYAMGSIAKDAMFLSTLLEEQGLLNKSETPYDILRRVFGGEDDMPLGALEDEAC